MQKRILVVLATIIATLAVTVLSGCETMTKMADKNVYGGSGDRVVYIHLFTDDMQRIWSCTCKSSDYTLEAYQSSYVLTVRKDGRIYRFVNAIIRIEEVDE